MVATTTLLVVVVLGLALVGVAWFSYTSEDEDDSNEVEDVVLDDGAIELRQPNIQTSTFGFVEEFYRWYRRRQKRRKLARKGYVKWILVDQSYSRPKFVKPERKGGGVPEFEYDGITYLFPEGSAAPDESTGMWTYVHAVGDADPVHLPDPMRTSIPGDLLTSYLDTRVSTEPPSWWDSLNLDAQDILMYAMGFIVVFAVLNRMVL